MRAVGFLAGVGTLLRAAQDVGCDVVGNVETRPYYRDPWIWRLNFAGAPHFGSIDEALSTGCFLEWALDADVALGHPPCGKFSRLGGTGARQERFNDAERKEWHAKRERDLGLLPQFVAMVNHLKPRTFAFDNLPRMTGAISESEWSELLPRYRMTFVTMTNWDYGSPQRRKRLWVIGSRGKKRFKFRPTKRRLRGPTDVLSALDGLPWQPWIDVPELAHVHHEPDAAPVGGYWARDDRGERFAIRDFVRYAAGFGLLPPGTLWPYQNNHGRYTRKPARARSVLGRPARTLSGNETLNHPLTGWPLTIRERARLMGWPDDFKLTDADHPLDRRWITKLALLTGRAVPSEFPRYLIKQLLDHAQTA